ncbi:uncharacterized protein LOC117306508 [Asterias rubens]|uniref:uncharacterized protein LOC117306508 n=1 Tax=Asterias rubens TaxID=7604 RepID=UPI001455ADBE|nr:uncharacterized protein LOC117306508 [Asterias rubens]
MNPMETAGTLMTFLLTLTLSRTHTLGSTVSPSGYIRVEEGTPSDPFSPLNAYQAAAPSPDTGEFPSSTIRHTPNSSSPSTSQYKQSEEDPDATPSYPPQETGQPTEEEEEVIDGLTARERNIRIMILRQQLMVKLGLTSLPPKSEAKPPRSLPPALKKRLLEHGTPQRDLPVYQPPESGMTEVLASAEKENNCSGFGYCFKFSLVKDTIGKQIKSVNLWLYMTAEEGNRSALRQITVMLLTVGEGGILRKELATKVVSKREGWFHFELPRERNDWTQLVHRLQIANAAEESSSQEAQPTNFPPISLADQRLPILSVAVDVNRKRKRLRRQNSNICQSGTDTCCLHRFQVEMSDVLQGIVEQPTTMFANFCKGSCMHVINFETLHANVMRDRALIETDADLKKELTPCCVPVDYFDPLSIIIRNQNNTFTTHIVSSISARSCGCK